MTSLAEPSTGAHHCQHLGLTRNFYPAVHPRHAGFGRNIGKRSLAAVVGDDALRRLAANPIRVHADFVPFPAPRAIGTYGRRERAQ